jgi:chromosome segregation ATPase
MEFKVGDRVRFLDGSPKSTVYKISKIDDHGIISVVYKNFDGNWQKCTRTGQQNEFVMVEQYQTKSELEQRIAVLELSNHNYKQMYLTDCTCICELKQRIAELEADIVKRDNASLIERAEIYDAHKQLIEDIKEADRRVGTLQEEAIQYKEQIAELETQLEQKYLTDHQIICELKKRLEGVNLRFEEMAKSNKQLREQLAEAQVQREYWSDAYANADLMTAEAQDAVEVMQALENMPKTCGLYNGVVKDRWSISTRCARETIGRGSTIREAMESAGLLKPKGE